jgi:excisionase family DNA binding protein
MEGSVQDTQRLITAHEVAQRLGIKSTAVYDLAKSGDLPHVRISERRIRFDADDLERWLDRRTVTRPATRPRAKR